MSKRGMLWMVGLVAFGFTYAAAVNITEVNVSFGYTTCQGMWNLTKWFGRSCSESLPPRLGVLALGTAALIVFGYFAEKANGPVTRPVTYVKPANLHALTKDAEAQHWRCQDCSFQTTDPEQVTLHNLYGSRGVANGNAHGFGAVTPRAPVSLPSPTRSASQRPEPNDIVPVLPSSAVFSHFGEVLAFGHDEGPAGVYSYGIWDGRDGERSGEFPFTDEGWDAAWDAFSAAEPDAVETTSPPHGFPRSDDLTQAHPAAAPATQFNERSEPEHKTCPDCAEEVRTAARKCRFCGYMFDSQPATQA